MELFWYIVIAIVIAIFFILDGYDFGAGIIHLFYAKKDKDKEVIAKSAGLFWDSNEVWLVAGGGLLFMAFPTFYASVFSGFYLPLMLVLWLIIFRAIGLELRNQFHHELWKTIWDKSFGVSSLLLALFFGVALGNVVRGVNLGEVQNGTSLYESHYFFLPLWNSDFSPLSPFPGVIDWFTIIIGLISVVTLTIHGANWVILKTNSSINDDLRKVVSNLCITLVGLNILSLIALKFVNPHCFENFTDKPYLLIFPTIYLAGLAGLFFKNRFKKDIYPFLFSSLTIVGGITATLASIFPSILISTNDINESLTIYNTTTTQHGLSISVYWGVLGFILVTIYMIVQNRLTSGKIDDMDYGH